MRRIDLRVVLLKYLYLSCLPSLERYQISKNHLLVAKLSFWRRVLTWNKSTLPFLLCYYLSFVIIRYIDILLSKVN